MQFAFSKLARPKVGVQTSRAWWQKSPNIYQPIYSNTWPLVALVLIAALESMVLYKAPLCSMSVHFPVKNP